MNAPAVDLRWELLHWATQIGNAAEDLAGTPQAAVLLKANRDLHDAVRKLDALPVPMNVELLTLGPDERAAADALEKALGDHDDHGQGRSTGILERAREAGVL